MSNLKIIKLGGSILSQPEQCLKVLKKCAQLYQAGEPLLLIHGGGPHINLALEQAGLTWKFKNGQRITSAAMMEIVQKVLLGQVNRQLVSQLLALNIPAFGLGGIDGTFLEAETFDPELQRVGRVRKVRAEIAELLLGQKLLPILAPIAWSVEEKAPLNVNADMVASAVAQALKAQNLVFVTDQKGILDEHKNCIQYLKLSGLYELIDRQVVTGGMLVKVEAIIQALKNQVSFVHVCHIDDFAENSTDSIPLVNIQGQGRKEGTLCSV